VFSVAASWIILGESGILKYSHRRQKEIARSRPDDIGMPSTHSEVPTLPGDCFHDGAQPLQGVLEWHTFLWEAAKKADVVTPKILALFHYKAILAIPEDWESARNIYLRMKDIVEESKQLLNLKLFDQSPENPHNVAFQERKSNAELSALSDRSYKDNSRTSVITRLLAEKRLQSLIRCKENRTTITPIGPLEILRMVARR
jgi:hypothetical protein